jgi:hypothetical protein
MSSFLGYQPTGRLTRVGARLSYDGKVEWKAIGVTPAPDLFAAVTADTTLPDDSVIPSGYRAIKLGQVLTKVTADQTIGLRIAGTPTAGTVTLNLYNSRRGGGGLATINFNSTAAQTKTAFEAVYGAGNVNVTGSTFPNQTQVVTFTGLLADSIQPPMTVASSTLTGGTPTVDAGTKAQTLTVTGTPASGSIVMAVFNPTTRTYTNVTLAYNSTAAQAQTALEAVYGVGGVFVTGGAWPGTPLVVYFNGIAGTSIIPAFTTVSSTFSEGTVAAALDAGVYSGYYGPFDPDATDGRQTLANGRCVVLDETVTENDPVTLLPIQANDNIGFGLIAGDVFLERIITTTSTQTLAAGPTQAELLAVLPMLNFVRF